MPFNNENIDEKFGNYIKNKRVIFVAPSFYLMTCPKGSFIDGFDIIIRTNGAYTIPENLHDIYGSRCDVLYVNSSYANIMQPLPVNDYKDKGIKFLCMKTDKYNMLPFYNETMYTRFLYSRQYNNFFSSLIGILILGDITQYAPAQLYITGMDFYLSGYPSYFEGYQPNKMIKTCGNKYKRNEYPYRPDKYVLTKGAGKPVHYLDRCMGYVYEMIKDGKIQVDSFMINILEEHYVK